MARMLLPTLLNRPGSEKVCRSGTVICSKGTGWEAEPDNFSLRYGNETQDQRDAIRLLERRSRRAFGAPAIPDRAGQDLRNSVVHLHAGAARPGDVPLPA